MRDALRSWKRLEKPDDDMVSEAGVVETKGDDTGQEPSNLAGQVLVHERETSNLIVEKEEMGLVVNEESVLDLDTGTGRNIGVDENGNKRRRLSSGDGNEEAGTEMTEEKKYGLNGKVQIGGRVLRSMLKREDDKKTGNGENNGAVVGESIDFDEFKKITVKEEADEFASTGFQKEDAKLRINDNDEKKLKRKRGRPPKVEEMKEQYQLVGEMHGKRGRPPKMEIKEEYQSVGECPRKPGRPPKMEKKVQDHSVGELHRKRGRPPKMQIEEQDQSVVELHRKRGRPPKMEIEEQDQPVGRRKRGRPPKAGLTYNILKVAHHRKGKVGFGRHKKPLKMRDDDVCSKNNSGKGLKGRKFSTVKKSIFAKTLETKSNEVALPLRSNLVKGPVAEKNGKSQEKQLVRDKIKELLFAAGWEVDYRPRNGKEYKDSVYVSLDKKTHWSITLAYNRLKMHYEAGDGEDKVYRAGFKFTPIPQEEFNTLTKVINKKRKSKQELKQKGKDEGKTVYGIYKKLKNEKIGSVVSMGKSMKGKKKRRCSLLEENDPDNTSSKGKLVLVKDDKRLKTQSNKRFAPLVRNTEKETDSEDDGYIPYDGKRTVLAWMIDQGTVLQNGKVYYMKRRMKSKVEGRIKGDGIHCDCCKEIVTVPEFEAHAGSKLCDPFKNIYTEGGTSLLQCLLDSWNKQDESELKGFLSIDVAGEDPNDDTCGVCGDGGDLICCDGCPSTFHQSCLDISKFPSGDWHCIYCCCKFCGLFGRSTNQKDSCDDTTSEALLTCCLCKEKYHRSCIVANCVKTDDSSDASFCGNRCQELSQRLEMLFGVKHEIEDGFSWTFIRRSDVGSDASQLKPEMLECNSKLAVALLVMDECFKPYIDHRSGINLIHSILYNHGSNFKRLNYSGFFTAILERGDEIICAASIRIHGNELAEMPFIGTRHMYRRQGMCRRLLNAIESALCSLNVELLVIPAISEMRNTWTSVFGFEPLQGQNKRKIKNMSLLAFPHVDMLQKNITEQHQFADENMIPTEVSCLQRQKNPTLHEVASECDVSGSSGSDEVLGSSAYQVNETMSAECGSPCDNVSEHAHNQAEEIKTYQNADSSCIVLEHDEKTVDLDTSLNYCDDSKDERQYISTSHISIEGTHEGRCGSDSLQGTENMHDEVKLTDEIVTNNNDAVDSPHNLVESIPNESSIVLCSGDSKESAGVICHDSESTILSTADVATVYDVSVKLQLAESVSESDKRISDGCEPRSNIDFVQPDSAGAKEVHFESATGCCSECGPGGCASSEAGPPTCALMHLRKQNNPDDLFVDCKKSSNVVSEQNADEAEVIFVRTADYQTGISSVDSQTVQLTSRSCAEIANGVNDSTKASSAAGSNAPLADGNIVVDDKPLMKHSSVVTLHCASADGTPCSSSGTEAIVLSNQAS